MSGPSWSILTPTGAAGAVAGILLCADDAAGLDRLLRECGAGELRVGNVKLCRLLGIDQGLAARWTQASAELMPHGGIAVLRGIAAKLESMGVREAAKGPARVMYPEAGDDVEAEMLAALARARSPLAIDLIMEHAARCRRGDAPIRADDARALRRLVEPALVVALGPANVGKSTLVNQLAGRQVSIVADEPGTTRDHVGVLIEMAGVVVRYLDTPGIRESADGIEARAGELAIEMAAGADLLLLCGDAAHPPEMPRALAAWRGARLTVCLRSDLGLPAWAADQTVSVREGRGVAVLVDRIARTLVPREAREATGAWWFWE